MKYTSLLLIVLFSFTGLCFAANQRNEKDKNLSRKNLEKEKLARKKIKTYLALGDSYTIGESVETENRFPVQLAKKLNDNGVPVSEPTILARTGWTTNELETATENRNLEPSYDLVTLLIGVNNQYRGRNTTEYRVQFVRLLNKSIYLAGSAKNVIVVSIPDYGVTPFARQKNPEKIAAEIETFNQINFEETSRAGAFYVNITPISKEAKNDSRLIASDGLHPSAEMYRLWVDEIFPVAKQILEKND
jgi:lysophospholipase L1-like esterase